MEYYLHEMPYEGENKKTALVKPRDDIQKILKSEGVKPIYVSGNESKRYQGNLFTRLGFHFKVVKALDQAFGMAGCGDVLYVQFPLVEHSLFQSKVFKKALKRGVKIILLIHDLELFRTVVNRNSSVLKRVRSYLEEKRIFRYCECAVVHNKKMYSMMENLGFPAEKTVTLEIFDYYIEGFECEKSENTGVNDGAVVIAGNLSRDKSQYVYELPDNCKFNLYGINYEGEKRDNIYYKGAFMPDELVYKMVGRYGLVWDGFSPESCLGAFGQYLKINNPHKMSLYLASGLPVIIWDEAAQATFVKEHGCGFAVSSLFEIKSRLATISDDEYRNMKRNAEAVGVRLRKGYYTRQAMKQCRLLING